MRRMKRILMSVILTIVFTTAFIPLPFASGAATVAEAATITLNKTAVTVYTSNTYSLKLSGTTREADWYSSDNTVATVTSGGVVTGIKKGTATITADLGQQEYTCKVSVKSPSISTSKLTMGKADVKTLSIKGATGNVTWKSSDAAIVTVNSNGEVTAVQAGKAKITGKYNNKSYYCAVTVLNGQITADATNLTISKDTTVNITVDNFEQDENLQYDISDDSIVDIDQGDWTGNTIPLTIKPIKKGTATITVTTDCKGEELLIKVAVTDASSNTNSTSGKELTAEEVYSKCSSSYVQINTNEAIGSGFFIDDYTVITNYHVIEGATSIKIQPLNGETYEVTSVLGYSKDLDIAILKVPVTRTPLQLNTHGVKSGEAVYAIGSSQGLTDTFTAGIVTNASRVIDDITYIQTDAAITNGNSGGPLLNAYGEVIGINAMQLSDGQNINFAIKIDQYKKVSLSSPLTAKEYYSLNSSGSTFSDSVIYEDKNKSGSMSTAQEITNGANVAGTIDNSSDYYKFTLKTKAKVSVFATNLSYFFSDLFSFNVRIYDSNSRLVASGHIKRGSVMDYIELGTELSEGTYYIAVSPKQSSYFDSIPYLISFACE